MIYLGADHRGFLLKQKLRDFLDTNNSPYQDLGATSYVQEDDYPTISFDVAQKVSQKHGDLGVLVCGSGAGAVIAANKVPGIRAGLCFSVPQVTAARHDDDINVLCLSADLVSENDNISILEKFLSTPFSGEERHLRRLRQIKSYESEKH